ncbi:MAG: hypothetical protein IT427_05205 [Pirellulales bacterium]|nr:hypothetical protein [Pirellulales bacterium]
MMRTNTFHFLLSFAAVVSMLAFVAGCEELDNAAGNGPVQARPVNTTVAGQAILAPDESLPKQAPSTENQPSGAAADSGAATPPVDASQTAMPDAGEATIKKAEGSDGVKGSGYGGGIITEPVSQYFRLQNRIQFEIQIPKQLQLWKAEHNRFPKDEAEYEKEILIPCGIDGMKGLPELPINCRYLYDSKTGDLLVETRTPTGSP